jgi:hypothetical protein
VVVNLVALMLLGTLVAANPQAAAPADGAGGAKAAPAVAEAKKEPIDEAEKKHAQWNLLRLLTLLATLAILLMFLGTIMLIRRMGRRLRNMPKAKQTRYFDLTIPPESEPPPHEPSAAERFPPS